MNYNYLILFILLIFLLINFNKPILEKFTINKKNMLIMGATSEIAEVIMKYSNQKFDFYLAGRNLEKLNQLKSKYKNVIIQQVDFSNKESIEAYFNDNKIKFDMVYNNYYDSNYIDDIHHQMKSNISNNIYFLEKLIPYLNKESKLVNISSGASDIVDFDNDILIYYSLIKHMIEKYTKILSKKYYSNKIGITCLKINDSYNTQLTRKMKKNYNFKMELKDVENLSSCFSFLNNISWNEVTGKIIKSNQVIDNSYFKTLDLTFSKSDIDSAYDKINKSKRYIGENPVKMSSQVKNFIKNFDINLEKYSSKGVELRNQLANHHSVQENQIFFYNGTTEYVNTLIKFFVKSSHNIITSPNWTGTDLSAHNNDIEIKDITEIKKGNYLVNNYDLILKSIDSLTRMIYFIAPIIKEDFYKFISKIPDNLIIIIDYCYFGFYPENNMYLNVDEINFSTKKIITLFTFSKFYSIPQLQLGYSISSPEMKLLLEKNSFYSISILKEKLALVALNDTVRNNTSRDYFINKRKEITQFLSNKNIDFFFDKLQYLFLKLEDEQKVKFAKYQDEYFIFELNDYIGIPLVKFDQFKTYL